MSKDSADAAAFADVYFFAAKKSLKTHTANPHSPQTPHPPENKFIVALRTSCPPRGPQA